MSTRLNTATAAQLFRGPLFSIDQHLDAIHEKLETAFATASATKQLFDTAAVLNMDVDAVGPLLQAGSTISDNQSSVLCAIADALLGVRRQLAEIHA